MAAEKDERNMRRQNRAEARRAREKELQRQVPKLVAAGVALVLCSVLAWWLQTGRNVRPQEEPTVPTGLSQPAEGETQRPRPQAAETVIHIAAAGDLNVTDRVVASGKIAGGYDYTSAILDVAPLLTNADLTLMNFEGNLYGDTYGTESAAAPRELMQNLADNGVDLLQTANSYAIHKGILGLSATLDAIRSAGMEPVGAWATNAEAEKARGYTIREVRGIKVAVVAFTKGMNNLALPAGSEKCVNLLYDDYATTYQDVAVSKIKKTLQEVAREQPDYTIALVHWGSEFNEEISASQKEIRDLLLDGGVDAILGTHSHLVQKVEYSKENDTLVAYSLGDFFGEGTTAGSNYSIVLDLEITRDNTTGQTRLTNYSYTPIYTLQPEESGEPGLRVVRLDQTVKAYEAGALDAVTEEAYERMTYARQRIDERVRGE